MTKKNIISKRHFFKHGSDSIFISYSHVYRVRTFISLSLALSLTVNKGPSLAKPCMQRLWTLNLYINNNLTSDHAAMSAIMTYKKPFFLAYL